MSIEWVAWDGCKARTRRGPHAFDARILNYSYCSHCGLILLRNDATRRAAKAQCQWEEEA